MKEAMFYEKTKDKIVKCNLCARRCLISEGQRGFCRVRENQKGKLFSLNYGKLCSIGIDPIQKKPFFHFAPGIQTLSIAAIGCNFRCKFCFTPDTKVITQKGAVSFEKIFDDDNTFQFDDGFVSFVKGYSAITHEGNYSDIIKAYKHFYDGEIIVIKPLCLPKLKCTPSHIFIVYDNESRKIREVAAKDLNMNHFLLLPKMVVKDKKPVLVDVKDILSHYETFYRKNTKISLEMAKKILKLHEMGKTSKEISKILTFHPVYIRKIIAKLKKDGISDNLIYEKNEVIENDSFIKFKTEKRPFIPRYINLDEKLAILLGYYCAEGHVTKYKKRRVSYNLVFSFGKCENNKIEKTKTLIKEIFNVTPRVVERRTTITVEIGKSSVAPIFKFLAGACSREKHVPSIIINCENKRIIHSFLKAYFEGDGYLGEEVLEFATVSENLAYDTCLLLLKIGILPSFYNFVQTSNVIEGRKIKVSDYFRVKIFGKEVINNFLNGMSNSDAHNRNPKYIEKENCYILPIRNISKESYSGFVYNIEVKDDSHSYLSNFVSVCNCCNWQISQEQEITGVSYTPEEVVKEALAHKCQGMSYTYTEPAIFAEFAYDTSKMARKKGLYNCWVTNGYTTPEAIKEVSKYLDAVVVDFKGSANPKFYKEFSQVPDVQPIFDALLAYKKNKMFLEVTDLLIPKIGDNLDDIKKLCRWVVENLGEETPMHFISFFPSYKLDLPATSTEALEKAYIIAKKQGLRYVYLGNVPGHKYESTYCPECGNLLIERKGILITRFLLKRDLKCPKCNEIIPIAGKDWIPKELWKK